MVSTSGNTLPKPLQLLNRWIGGGSAGAYTPGFEGGVGVNTSGLLMTTVGKVTFVDPAGDYFVVTDGSAAVDAARRTGILVWAKGLQLPQINSYLTVTGLSGSYITASHLYPVLRLRGQGDIVTH